MKILKLLLIAIILLILAFLARVYWQNAQVPDLGHSNGQLAPLGSKPNSVSTQTDQADKRVAPWPFKSDRETTLQAILAAVESYGGARIISQDSHYLRVLFTTPLMRYNDDAEFYLDEAAGLVHFRSASRAGTSDLGLNRARFEQLTALYQQQ